MQLKRNTQTEHEKLRDSVYAALETGNQGRARLLMREYAGVSPDEARTLKAELIKDYGFSA